MSELKACTTQQDLAPKEQTMGDRLERWDKAIEEYNSTYRWYEKVLKLMPTSEFKTWHRIQKYTAVRAYEVLEEVRIKTEKEKAECLITLTPVEYMRLAENITNAVTKIVVDGLRKRGYK